VKKLGGPYVDEKGDTKRDPKTDKMKCVFNEVFLECQSTANMMTNTLMKKIKDRLKEA
jgi:hypothetical protein